MSSDFRQLTVTLTSVFSKLHVISEAGEGCAGSLSFTLPHHSSALFLLASLCGLVPDPESLPETWTSKRPMPTCLKDHTHVLSAQ